MTDEQTIERLNATASAVSGRSGSPIAERQRVQREAAERIAARDGSRVGYWPEDDRPGYVSPPVYFIPAGPAIALARVADDYGIHERAREDSTDPEDALLVNLPHDEHEDFPQGE